eukprot:scaffold14098_cov157-Skeletonema_marinoi.AAC.7
MTILVRSEERKVDVGLGLERLLNTGSEFINDYCHFPDSDFGDNAWIANYSSRSVSFSGIATWITAFSQLYEMTDACNDLSTVKGLWAILKKLPRGEFVTKYMYEQLMEASTNNLWNGIENAITTNPVIEFVSKQIDEIATVLRDDSLDVDGEHRSENRRRLRDIIKKFDNSTHFKYDFQEPDEIVLARKTANLMRKSIEEEKEKLRDKPSNATAVIYIEQCAINAIEKQSWGPNALRRLISSKSNEKKAMGLHGQVASYRIVPNTDGRICFAVIQSFCPILGQSSEVNENGRHHGATARIRGVLDYVTLVGINAIAGVISPEHAENVRRKCMSLLIMWEGTAGDFGKKQEIEMSKLNMGIIRFLPKGFNGGRFVQEGTVALGNLFSSNGMNEYYTALMLLQLGMPCFAQAVHLSAGEEINQENLRESMDELRKKQRGMDLQKRSAEQRNNISNGLKGKGNGKKKKKLSAEHNNNISKAKKGKKHSTEHIIAIVLGKKILKVEKASRVGARYEILEYECKKCKKEKSDYTRIHHVFGIELFNEASMNATCPCCGVREWDLRTNTKRFKCLGTISLRRLKKRKAKVSRS